MKKIILASLCATFFLAAGSARADCWWGVDPSTGQYTQVCGGESGGGGGCSWGVDPTTGQWTQVCGMVPAAPAPSSN